MVLDAVTVRNLELVEPLQGGPPGSTLLHAIDQTSTPMGKRLLRQWLLRPSLDRNEIEARLDAVEELHRETIARTEIERELSHILDIERLLARVSMAQCSPRDVGGLGASFSHLPMLQALVGRLTAPRLRELHERIEKLADIRTVIYRTLADEPPVNLSDGGVVRAGLNPELDELREIRKNSKGYIAQMEARERQRTGIQSLKVRFNNVFGYYIEVSKANLAHVPPDYERKQTLVNAERYVKPKQPQITGINRNTLSPIEPHRTLLVLAIRQDWNGRKERILA
jgi:DNA mismatch repair protein MutS